MHLPDWRGYGARGMRSAGPGVLPVLLVVLATLLAVWLAAESNQQKSAENSRPLIMAPVSNR